VFLIGAAIVVMILIIAISPVLSTYVTLLFERFRQWLFHLKELI